MSAQIKMDRPAFVFVGNNGYTYVETVGVSEEHAMALAMTSVFQYDVDPNWHEGHIRARWGLLFNDMGRISPAAIIPIKQEDNHVQTPEGPGTT